MGKHAECCEEHCVHTDLVNKVLKDLPDEDALYDLAELFKVFGDSTRVRILFALFESACARNGALGVFDFRKSCVTFAGRFAVPDYYAARILLCPVD